jgi:hypothetical protein
MGQKGKAIGSRGPKVGECEELCPWKIGDVVDFTPEGNFCQARRFSEDVHPLPGTGDVKLF